MDTARWRETDLTRTVLEWWYEDLHGRQPDISPAAHSGALCDDCDAVLAATAVTGVVDSYVGDETLSERAVLTLEYLIVHGFAMNMHFLTACA